MKHLLKKNICSGYFIGAVLLVVLSCFITVSVNDKYENIKVLMINNVNTFYYGAFVNNFLLNSCSAVIAILGSYKSIFDKSQIKTYGALRSKTIVTIITGGLTLPIGQLIFLFMLSVSMPMREATFIPWGIFSYVYNYSYLNYFIICITNSLLVGVVYSLFGFSITYNSKNKYLGVILPVAVSNISVYLPFVDNGTIFKFIPIEPYNITGIQRNTTDHFISFVFVMLLIVIIFICKSKSITYTEEIKNNEK